MPIYEYACGKCGDVIELIRRIADAEPTAHEGCGGALRRLVSAPSVRTKDNDGLTGSTHSSILRADDNFKSAKGKSRKPASVARPSTHRESGVKPGKK